MILFTHKNMKELRINSVIIIEHNIYLLVGIEKRFSVYTVPPFDSQVGEVIYLSQNQSRVGPIFFLRFLFLFLRSNQCYHEGK